MNRQLKKRKRKRKRFFLFTLLLFILIVFTSISYGAYLTYKLTKAATQANDELERGEKSEKRLTQVDPKKDNFSVLFVGVDERNNEEKSRSDALILATFNKDEKSIKMVSIPRDSKVEIVGKVSKVSMDKITHAHFFGGMDMTIATVEHLFEMPVDYYVKLNFQGFIEIIDTLGGITVDVPYTFTESNSDDVRDAITVEKGRQHLNGEEALAFARTRKKDNDFERGKRQLQVIKAVIDKGLTFSSVTKYDDVIDSLGENMSTNFSLGNIIALSKYSNSISNIKSLELKGVDDWSSEGYFYILDEISVQQVSEELKEHLELQPPNQITNHSLKW